MKIERGFTLVEILVAIAIVAIVGTIMVVIFTNTLRGSNKAQLLSVIKQNGQAVLENMDKTIRNADNVVCPGDDISSNTIVVVKDGTYSRYRIVLVGDSPGSAPAACIGTGKNGCIVQDNPTRQLTESTPSFIGRICSSTDLMDSLAANILTDTDTKTGVSVDSQSQSRLFSVSKPSGSKAIVTIEFKLKPGTGAPATIAGQIDPVAFQTTIELR